MQSSLISNLITTSPETKQVITLSFNRKQSINHISFKIDENFKWLFENVSKDNSFLKWRGLARDLRLILETQFGTLEDHQTYSLFSIELQKKLFGTVKRVLRFYFGSELNSLQEICSRLKFDRFFSQRINIVLTQFLFCYSSVLRCS